MKSRPAGTRRFPIDIVADDRPSHFRAMHAQLVGATGDRLQREPGQSRTAAHDCPCSGRWQPSLVSLHPPAPRFVALGERDIDSSLFGFWSAFDDGPIGFADLALLEQLAQQRQGLAVASEHQAPGRVAVEAMCQRGGARQAESQRVEIVLEGIAAFRPTMHGQPRRLVDHQHQPVAIEQAGEHLFRCHAETAITSAI